MADAGVLSPLQAGAMHMERVLSSVTDQVSTLAAAVDGLTRGVDARPTADAVAAERARGDARVAAVEARLAALEAAVLVRGAGNDGGGGNDENDGDDGTATPVTIGDHVARLYAGLRAANETLAESASSAALADVEYTLQQGLEAQAAEVQRDRASQEQMTRLEQAHEARHLLL